MSESRPWRMVRLSEVEAVPWRHTQLRWHPLRHALGTHVAGLSAYTAEAAGEDVVEEHTETADGRGHEEVYLVMEGRARFQLDGEEVDSWAGNVHPYRPGVRRHAVALQAGTTVLVLGGDPVFEPSASEWIERARPLIRSDPAAAEVILGDLQEVLGDDRAGAVGQALLLVGRGRREEAREKIRQLLAEAPALRETLLADPDLHGLVP